MMDHSLIILLQYLEILFPEPAANLDVCKRMKLSRNVKDNVLLTSDCNDETVVSRVVQNFDLNELPTNYVETELGPKVVRDFDLNELPTNDISDEIIRHELYATLYVERE